MFINFKLEYLRVVQVEFGVLLELGLVSQSVVLVDHVDIVHRTIILDTEIRRRISAIITSVISLMTVSHYAVKI